MTTEQSETQPPQENKPTPKLSLVSEGQNLPANSAPEAPANGQPMELTPEEKKQMAKAMKAMEKRGMKPAPGFAWNPLRKLQPNIPCPCLSGKKFKVCCRDQLAPIVEESVAKQFAEQMQKEDLVFLTPDNHDKIQARIAPHVKAELDKQAAIAREKEIAAKAEIDRAMAKARR